MKKLILAFLLLITGLVRGQSWQADTLKYWENAGFKDSVGNYYGPDTVLTESIIIVIDKGYLTIDKHNAHFEAKITDTLRREITGQHSYTMTYKIYKSVRDKQGYYMELYISYYMGRVTHIGLGYGTQLFIYYIGNELINTSVWNIQKHLKSYSKELK